MRILGLGLLTILLVALLRFTLLTPDVVSFVGLQGDEIRRTYDLASRDGNEESCLPPGSGTSHRIGMRGSDSWTALAGSPGFVSVGFDLPRAASVVSGAVVLDIAAELQEQAAGRLRVSINGERRGEIILAAGRSQSEIRIDLKPRDLVRNRLDVSLAAVGSFPQNICSREWTGGLIVRVEPTSRIELETTGPMTDIDDRLLATGSPRQMIWPTTPSDDRETARLMAYAVAGQLRGNRSEFVTETDDGCSGAVSLARSDLSALSDAMPEDDAQTSPDVWPLFFARGNDTAGVRYFTYESAWRHAYDLRQMPGAEYPTALDLRMRVVGLQDEAKWLLSVTLNDTLVHSERMSGHTLDIIRKVPLPAALHRFSNALEVRISSDERQDLAICQDGAASTAQMLPSTALIGGIAPKDETVRALIISLNGPLNLRVPDTLSAMDASTAVDFLAGAFGTRAAWQVGDESDDSLPLVTVTTALDAAAQYEALAARLTNREFWLVWPQEDEPGALQYRQIRAAGVGPPVIDIDDGARIGAIVALPRSRTLARTSTLETDEAHAATPAVAPATVHAFP